MDPVQQPLLESLADLCPQTTRIDMISTVTGQLIDGSPVGGDYWWHNVRKSVRFADAMGQLADRGVQRVVELDRTRRSPTRSSNVFRKAAKPSSPSPPCGASKTTISVCAKRWEICMSQGWRSTGTKSSPGRLQHCVCRRWRWSTRSCGPNRSSRRDCGKEKATDHCWVSRLMHR